MGENVTPSEKGLITLCEGSILVLSVPSIINLRLAYPLVDELTPWEVWTYLVGNGL